MSSASSSNDARQVLQWEALKWTDDTQEIREGSKRYILGINVRLTNIVERMAPWRRRENDVVVFTHGKWLTTKQIKQKTAKNILSSLNGWSLLVVDRYVVSLVDNECNLYLRVSRSSSSMDIDQKGNTSCRLSFAISSLSPTSLSRLLLRLLDMYISQGRYLPLIYDVHWIYVNSPQFLADGWSRQHVLVARRERERKDKISWYRCASKHRIDRIVKSEEEAGMLNEPLSNAVFLCQLVSLINIFASSRIPLAVRFSFLSLPSVARSFSLSLCFPLSRSFEQTQRCWMD